MDEREPEAVRHLAPASGDHRDFHVHNVHIRPAVVDAHAHTRGDRLTLHEDPRHGSHCEGRIRIVVSGFPGPRRVRITAPSGRQWEIPLTDGTDVGIVAGSTVTELGSHRAELLDAGGAVDWTHHFIVGEGLDELYPPGHPRAHAHPDDYNPAAGELRRAEP